MKENKWILIFLASIFCTVVVACTVNFYMDPLWIFRTSNPFNKRQYEFNERVQKSSFLKYNSSDFDSVLIGASAATYYNHTYFKDLRLFNFAVRELRASEIQKLADFTTKSTNRVPKNIFLSLDFVMYQKHKDSKELSFIEKLPDNKYIYALKNYLNPGILKYSLNTIYNSVTEQTGLRSYDRMLNAYTRKLPLGHVRYEMKKYESKYFAPIEENTTYKALLQSFNKKYKQSKITVFTPPLGSPLIKKIYKDPRLFSLYTQWIKDMVSVFDKVYVMTLPSYLSKNYLELSIDGVHYYPDTGRDIIKSVLEFKSNNYGTVVTRDSLQQFITFLNFVRKHNTNPKNVSN